MQKKKGNFKCPFLDSGEWLQSYVGRQTQPRGWRDGWREGCVEQTCPEWETKMRTVKWNVHLWAVEVRKRGGRRGGRVKHLRVCVTTAHLGHTTERKPAWSHRRVRAHTVNVLFCSGEGTRPCGLRLPQASNMTQKLSNLTLKNESNSQQRGEPSILRTDNYQSLWTLNTFLFLKSSTEVWLLCCWPFAAESCWTSPVAQIRPRNMFEAQCFQAAAAE